ncbi:MAG: FAD-dependent oxidoreductase [Firmicutes bacterium]|nr:FAD-dependent oxidoreductase [Bacillota bacterium]
MNARVKKISISDALPVGKHTFTFSVDIDQEKCTGCGICAIECPSRIIEMAPRAGVYKSYCTENCLAENDVRAAMFSIREGGNYSDAWKALTAVNPLLACTGRACPHPCEEVCSRTYLDEAVNLHEFERFIGDYGIKNGLKHTLPSNKRDEHIAVIGGGPVGLSCAYHLVLRGFQVTIFEKQEMLGGMLRYGVPAFRVPKDILDAEINAILALGIEVNCGVTVGSDRLINKLKIDYDAIFLAMGAQRELKLAVPGNESVISGLSFLHNAAENRLIALGENVVVIGGGNVAVDCARTAIRSGAKNVTLVCVEERYAMPALERDIIEGLEEGIKITCKYGVKYIEANTVVLKGCIRVFDENNRFNPLYDENDTLSLPADTVISAIGQAPDTDWLAKDGGVQTMRGGFVLINNERDCATNVLGIYAGGDVTYHEKYGSIAGAINMGKNAALSIVQKLTGEAPQYVQTPTPVVSSIDQAKYNKIAPRNEAAILSPAARLAATDRDMIPALSESVLGQEIQRCLVCAAAVAEYVGPQNAKLFNIACNNCHNCVSVCKEKAISFAYKTFGRSSEIKFSDD